jgi:acyl-CoA thioester hydrolase
MYKHNTTLRVRYGETDQMGYVYHGNYAQYFEIGREEAMRSLGSDYNSLEKEGVMMPVISLWTKYYHPAHYDDVLTIRTTIKQMPNIRMKFDYEILNAESKLISVGQTTLVFVDRNTRKPVRPPEWFVELLKPYFTQSEGK